VLGGDGPVRPRSSARAGPRAPRPWGAAEEVSPIERRPSPSSPGALPLFVAAPVGAELVVLLSLLGVGEDVVRLVDLLEALLGRLVVRVEVGVELTGELAVSRADLFVGGSLFEPQGRVVVLELHPWHLVPRPPGTRLRRYRTARSAGRPPGQAGPQRMGRRRPGQPRTPPGRRPAWPGRGRSAPTGSGRRCPTGSPSAARRSCPRPGPSSRPGSCPGCRAASSRPGRPGCRRGCAPRSP